MAEAAEEVIIEDDESEAPSEDSAAAEESAETSSDTETEEGSATSESVVTKTETETTTIAEKTDCTPSTADAEIVEEAVTAAAAENATKSSVAPLIEVEATDTEADGLSADPADYSVYPAGEGTEEFALAA